MGRWHEFPAIGSANNSDSFILLTLAGPHEYCDFFIHSPLNTSENKLKPIVTHQRVEKTTFILVDNKNNCQLQPFNINILPDGQFTL